MRFKIENLTLEEIIYIESCLIERLYSLEKELNFIEFNSDMEKINIENEVLFNKSISNKIKY